MAGALDADVAIIETVVAAFFILVIPFLYLGVIAVFLLLLGAGASLLAWFGLRSGSDNGVSLAALLGRLDPAFALLFGVIAISVPDWTGPTEMALLFLFSGVFVLYLVESDKRAVGLSPMRDAEL